jgi:hypothetical protein
MRAIYVEVANDRAQPAMARINAATAWLNRTEGMPTAKIVTAQADDDLSQMTDDEFVEEVKRHRAKLRACIGGATAFHGDPAPTALRERVIAELADDPRGLRVTFVWITDRGSAGYDVLGWRDEAESEGDTGAGATFSRVYPHEVERVPCRPIPALQKDGTLPT